MMEDGNAWEKVLDKLVDSSKHVLHRKTKEEIVKYCVENKMTRSMAENYLKTFEKSDQKNSVLARKKLKEAIEKYGAGEFTESLQSITECIIHMNKNDKRLAAAYSKRSLLLWQERRFSECINDIDMAIDSGHEEQVKLMIRKAHCLTELGNFEEAEGVLTDCLTSEKHKVDHFDVLGELEEIKLKKNAQAPVSRKDCLPEPVGGRNENFVSASKYLSLHYDEIKGRHVIATEDIKMGDVLFVEEPFACVWFDKGCQNCLKQNTVPIPCLNCTAVTYCSSKCRDEFWKRVHSFECGFSRLFRSVGIAEMGLRVVLNASSSLNELKKILENITEPDYTNGIVLYKSKGYASVYGLVHNTEKYEETDLFKYAMTALLLALYMRNWTEYFPSTSGDEDLKLLTSVICLHITQMICNGSGVTKISVTEGTGEMGQGLEFTSTRRCGAGIYPSLSMMNHSCEPSIINSFQNKWAITRAAKDIKKGEEVFNCYGPHARRDKRAYRQESLRKQYFFQCKCIACSRAVDLQDIFTAFKCVACKGPSIPKADNVTSAFCVACGKASRITVELLAKHQKFNSLLEEGRVAGKEEGLKKCLASWILAREIFYKFHEDLGLAAVEVARFLLLFGEFEKCISFLHCSVLSVEARFGSFSIELANELEHLATVVLYYYLQNCNNNKKPELARQGIRYFDKAEHIFCLLYGSDFEGLKELEMKKRKLKQYVEAY